MNFFLTLFVIINISFSADKVFVACEGNFYQGNGSLWTISEGEVDENIYEQNWDVLQSVYVYDDMLFVISTGTSTVHVFSITESGLEPITDINTNGSGPREMIIFGDYLYFTNWYTTDVKKLNLDTWTIDYEISMPGLPEDIILVDNMLYVSIIMDNDWTDGNQVVSLDPLSNSIVESYDVGDGPSELLLYNDDIYVSRTYYDSNWNAFYGTSRISDGVVEIADYGTGAVCGGGILKYQNTVYRVYDGGIAQLDDDLQILPETRIGDYGVGEIYSAEVVGEDIYFGLTDFTQPDFVAVMNSQGVEINRYEVGVFPGDIAIWSPCAPNGDINSDGNLNVSDIVEIVYNIINDVYYTCSADIDNNQVIDVIDVILLVQQILGIESYYGAVNWIDNHFPELRVFDKLKLASSKIK